MHCHKAPASAAPLKPYSLFGCQFPTLPGWKRYLRRATMDQSRAIIFGTGCSRCVCWRTAHWAETGTEPRCRRLEGSPLLIPPKRCLRRIAGHVGEVIHTPIEGYGDAWCHAVEVVAALGVRRSDAGHWEPGGADPRSGGGSIGCHGCTIIDCH